MKDLRKLCENAIWLWDADCDLDGIIDEMRTALAQPEPVAPTDEELRALWRLGWQSKDPEDGAVLFAEEVLARWGRPTIEPVPVAERLPGLEDCDAEGCCWFYSGRYGRWERLLHELSHGYTHWLPHHALPLPQP